MLRGAHEAETRRGLVDRVPLERFASPAEVAGLVTYLASERAGYITGEVVSINGGIYMD